MEIGKPKEIIHVKPARNPIPEPVQLPQSEPAPVSAPSEPEKVPA